MKALEILEKNQPTKERAGEFIKSIKRNLKKDIIDTLEDQIERLQDKMYSLKDMSISTDLNQGVTAVDRDQAEARFKQIIECEYELHLLKRELKIKNESYTKYFGKDKDEKVED